MYLQPATPLPVRRSRRASRMNGLGIVMPSQIERILPIYAQRYPQSFPLPGPPGRQPFFNEAPPTTTTTTSPAGNPSQGQCVVESSPETGGVTSLVPCSTLGPNRGGTVAPANPAIPSTPVPSNYPVTQPFYAADGSVWTFNSTQGQWVESQAVNNYFPQYPGATPVPAGYPLTQPYFAADGSVWNWNPTTQNWVETQLPGSAAAALLTQQSGGAAAPSVNVSNAPAAPSSYQSILDWLSEETLISGFPNWGIVAAAAGAYLFLKNRGTGRR